jgi:hypothetical protein
MKILLVVKSKVMENLGVMYLSAIAKKTGHQCKIVAFDLAQTMARIRRREKGGWCGAHCRN